MLRSYTSVTPFKIAEMVIIVVETFVTTIALLPTARLSRQSSRVVLYVQNRPLEVKKELQD